MPPMRNLHSEGLARPEKDQASERARGRYCPALVAAMPGLVSEPRLLPGRELIRHGEEPDRRAS
jgi:hypothetical protein